MKNSFWIWGPAAGVAAGLVVATDMTILDWRVNPGGIFYDAQGTNWAVVTETAVSWFVPVTALVCALSAPVLYWLRRRK